LPYVGLAIALGEMCIVDYETKKNALFIEVAVLVNGESDPEMYKDSQDDYWTSEEIGVVFTSEANQTNHDLYHNKSKIESIQTIANYRNKSVEMIGGREVPVNSWRKDLMVTDDEIIELIKSNKINGVSLNTGLEVSSTCAKELKNIEGNIYYNRDIENKECMIPLFTSLVPDPSNGYSMNVYSYDKFLAKSENPEELIEMIKSRSSGGGKLTKFEKFKEMLKSFGESVIDLADETENSEEIEEQKEAEMNKADEEQSSESITIDDIKTVVEEAVKPLSDRRDNVESELEDIKKENEESPESQKSADVVKEEDSIDDRRDEIRKNIFDKHFSDEEDIYDIWITLMAEDCVVIEVHDEYNKYFKVDYSIDDDKKITIGDLVEVELQYAEKGATEEETEEENAEKTAPESQKSKQPRIKVNNEKLESVEMEKQNEPKINHLGIPVRSTKELAKAKNQFNF